MTPLDPFAPEVRADPFPVYAALREQGRLHWNEAQEAWVVPRYHDCVAVLRAPNTSVDGRHAVRVGPRRSSLRTDNPLAALDVRPMLFSDPPDHTRLRSLVSKAFTPKRVEALRPHIAQLVDGLLDAAAERGSMDVVADLAFPLPVIVICELLGVPVADRDDLKAWSRDLARTIDPIVSDDDVMRAAMAGMQFVNYLNLLIDERRRSPRDDLLSALIAAEDDGERLTHQELLVNTILLFVAGHETTQNLIGNGVAALLRHPDQLALLREDPSLDRGMVEEVLRYDSPVQITARVTTADLTMWDENLISHGETLILLLGSAHRDPDVFEDPDRFDIRRDNAQRNIAFGHGIHHCLGAALARAEGELAVGRLVCRFPGLALAGEPVRAEMFTLRGLSSLPVSL